MAELGSSLTSVFEAEANVTCEKVAGYHPLHQFHKKFWGKCMEDEKSEWLKAQPRREDQVVDVDEDGEDKMDLDDDIIPGPGCYALHVDIEDIIPMRMWIRADYIRIYDRCQAFCAKYAEDRQRPPPSVVLTGQPGIGKSVWICYAARRRAAERKPFIWFFSMCLYLFVDEGVYQMPENWQHHMFCFTVWALVDSDESCPDVLSRLLPHNTRLFVVYATSPARDRWSSLPKTTRNLVVIMNPWGREEIKRAALIQKVPEAHVDKIFDLFGPIPRLCFEISCDDDLLFLYEHQMNTAINSITAENFQKLVHGVVELSMHAVSHKLCLISREDRDRVASLPVVAPISPFISSKLANRFRSLKRSEKLSLYQHSAREPQSRAMAGVFFEVLVQSDLDHGISLELVPMVARSRKGNRSELQARWFSSHLRLPNSKLEESRLEALGKALVIDIQPERTDEYTDDGLLAVKPNVLYIPEAANQKAIDSFILFQGFLYLFQITIGATHDINHGLMDIAEKLGFPPRNRWRFVFLIPPGTTLTVRRPRIDPLWNFVPYSAVVKAESSTR